MQAGRGKAVQQERGLWAFGLQQTGWCPPTLGMAICFTQFTLWWCSSFLEILSETYPEIMFYQLSGYPLAQSSWNIKITIPDIDTSVSLKFQYFINFWYSSQAYILTNISIDLEIYIIMWKKQIAEQHACYEPTFVNIKPQNNVYIFAHIHKAIYQLLPFITSGVKMEKNWRLIYVFIYLGCFT